jgi:4'-phosphopantetheinyl transferase
VSRWASVKLPLRRRALPNKRVVDLWLTDLTDLPLQAGPDGASRKERVLRQRIQQQFILRLLLGSYLGVPGKDVGLVRSETGKPGLLPAQAESGLCFNVSHSGDWLAIAVSRDVPVGVDIECQRQLRRPADLARRYFPAAEADWLSQLAEPSLSRAFMSQWTAREALVKAMGSSLAEAICDLSLSWAPAGIGQLPASWPEPAGWSLIAPEMPSGLIGHVAAPAVDLRLDCHFLQTG